MKTEAPPEWHRLFNAALDDQLDDTSREQLATLLKSSAEARQLWFLYQDNECSLAELKPRTKVEPVRAATSRLQWRPLMAAAAGIVFGMFCTSVVFGLVTQRAALVKMTPLEVFDPGLENSKSVRIHGVPRRVGQWVADSARVVTAENGVEPREGQRMLRLEPIPREKKVQDHSSRAYQKLDLRSLPEASRAGDAEVQVTASFCATKSEIISRYSIRIIALEEAPEELRKVFWPKTLGEGVVSVVQRFDTAPGDRGWHTFSLKMPLPRGARTLVFILAAEAPEDPSVEASIHYLDDVHVSVLTPQPQS